MLSLNEVLIPFCNYYIEISFIFYKPYTSSDKISMDVVYSQGYVAFNTLLPEHFSTPIKKHMYWGSLQLLSDLWSLETLFSGSKCLLILNIKEAYDTCPLLSVFSP